MTVTSAVAQALGHFESVLGQELPKGTSTGEFLIDNVSSKPHHQTVQFKCLNV